MVRYFCRVRRVSVELISTDHVYVAMGGPGLSERFYDRVMAVPGNGANGRSTLDEVRETNLMESAVVLVVRLFIRPGREVAFREFEIEAARVMQRYGGRIDRVIRASRQEKTLLPHEIHILSFPSLERFEAYREDQHLAKLESLRQSAIARTEVTMGEEGEPYV
jgi:uncharacterized protein (DUF1330 family)